MSKTKIQPAETIAIVTAKPIKNKAPKKPASLPYPADASKQDRMIALLKRNGGATIEELMNATGWKAHSVRGAISGALKKRMRLNVISIMEKRGRIYRISGDRA